MKASKINDSKRRDIASTRERISPQIDLHINGNLKIVGTEVMIDLWNI